MIKFNAFELKMIALVLMLMDHLYIAFPNAFSAWYHPLSRVVAPIFGFLLVEGLFHTRNKLRYNIRLFGWAIFMQIGNVVINIALKSKEISVYNNIFLTLTLGLTIINLIEFSKNKEGIKKIGILFISISLISLGLFTEGGIVLIPFILITYLFRGNEKKQIVLYLFLSIILFSVNYNTYSTAKETISMLMFNSDFLFILVVPFMILYNGKRGMNNKFSKYLFYIFYPLHLWIIAILQFRFQY
ncbi:TraX family protein [Paraclostridium tenue]